MIGINSAIKSRSGGFQGVGLAMSSNLAKNIMEQLLQERRCPSRLPGRADPGPHDRELAARLGLRKDQTGVLVTQVFDKTPAAKAGLKDGDVITAVGGKPVKDRTTCR